MIKSDIEYREARNRMDFLLNQMNSKSIDIESDLAGQLVCLTSEVNDFENRVIQKWLDKDLDCEEEDERQHH